jgi:hypothetical protein
LRRRSDDLGIGDAVVFPGRVAPAEVLGLLDAASLVLVPSRAETFGLVAIEAALMQRPVVASRVGGLREVVADGLTGLLVPADDAGAMAEAAIALLGDEARCRRLGMAARARAQVLFSTIATSTGTPSSTAAWSEASSPGAETSGERAPARRCRDLRLQPAGHDSHRRQCPSRGPAARPLRRRRRASAWPGR